MDSLTSNRTAVLGIPFLNLFCPRSQLFYFPLSFSFFHLIFFPLILYPPLVLLCFFILILSLHLDSNLNLSSWAGWLEIWLLYRRHTETRSLEKADEVLDVEFGIHWARSSHGLVYAGRMCVWDLFCACCGEQAVPKRRQEYNPRMMMPHPLSTFCPLNPTLVGWHFSESSE